MRLFRKSKAVQEPVLVEAVNSCPEVVREPSPPPALQLNFELPLLPPSSLDFDGPVAQPSDSDQPIAHTQSHPMLASTDQPEPALPAANSSATATLFEQLAREQQRSTGSYAFDYPVHIDDTVQRTPEDTVKSQLMEQFGHRSVPTPVRAPPSASTSAPHLSQAQQARTMHQQIEHILRTTAAQPTEIRMLSGSPSSQSNASSEDDTEQKLSNSMAGMSLGAKYVGEKMSDRAVYIQRMREASAMGKVTAGGRAVVPSETDVEDENDLVPLGGLRQMKVSTAPNSTLGTPNMARGPAFQQQPYGAMANSPTGHPLAMLAQAAQSPRQHMYQQQPQYMPSPLSGTIKPYASGSMAGAQGVMHQPGPYAGLNPGMSHQSQTNGYSAQSSPLPQMAYPRIAGSGQQMQAGGMFRSPMPGNTNVGYGGVGMSRGPAMQDQGKPMYTPSPLRQIPAYCQSPMETLPAMAGYMPAPASSGHPLAQQQQQHHHQQHIQQHQIQQPHHQQQVQQQQVQQHQHGASANTQQGALMNFIPNRDRCRGSMAKNPLMCDINKAKEFSARDYNTRPTLLAEADSRRLAKKNMPGLGGTTCHSFQPEVVQPIVQQQPPLEAYMPPSPSRPHGHRNYQGHPHDPYYAHQPEPAHYQSPSHHYDDMDRNYASPSPNIKHRSDVRSGGRGRGRTTKRHQRYEDEYDQYDDRAPVREFRQRVPHRQPRGRDALGRSHRRHDERYYDHYDYSDSYASDYYDELDDDYDECYGNRGGQRPLPRRATQYWPRGTPRGEPRMYEGRRTHPHGHRDVVDEGLRKHRGAHLDDPRDSNSVVRAATRGADRQTAAEVCDPVASAGTHGATPRSQFGRMLANIKRHAAPSKTLSPQQSPNITPATCDNSSEAGDEHVGQAMEDNMAHTTESTNNSAAQDVDDMTNSVTQGVDTCSEVSDMSPANSVCPTPAAPVAAVVAAN
ncbi:hypothetical protein IW147_003853 [Coemansia sp. RSA 720]|nr:hypothetical protein IW147_003853 [Coemansia sp. RSA 720]